MRLFVFIATITLCLVGSSASLQRFDHKSPKKDGSLSFLVIGDWGRNGEHNQTAVASQMSVVAKKLDINFVISTGDNFYNYGLKGINDPAFYDSFTKIYSAPTLQKQWYSILGNHDYWGDVEAQLSPALTRRDKRWLCLRSYILNAGFVEFFFVDTTPFVEMYFTKPRRKAYDWRGVLPREKYISNLLKDVDMALQQSRANWKIVVGHHTIKSIGEHGVTKELEKHLLPMLQKHNVDVYMNGHDHSLQHISSKIQFFTSGGGSKAWSGVVRKGNPEELKFFYDGQGFMSVQITKNTLDIAFYDVFGKVLHRWNKSK